MMRDTLDITVNTAKLMLLGFSLYAVVMIAKPEEFELRKGQVTEWWTQTVQQQSKTDSSGSNNSSPGATNPPDATWGF